MVSYRFTFILISLLALTLAPLRAQDVTITAPAFLNPETTTADAPPTFKKKPSVDYPDELKRESVQGYALVLWLISAEGQRMLCAHGGTHPYFTKAGILNRETETTLLLKDGKPVAGLTWYAVIFNPATASAKKKDASPRLLAVVPAQVRAKDLGQIDFQNLPTAPVKLQLDATGAITGFTIENSGAEKFREAITKALSQWQLAPARKDGVPYATEWNVDVVLCTPMVAVLSSAKNRGQRYDVIPKLTRTVDPVYPRIMSSSGLRGEVTVQFIVDPKGNVSEATVTKSSHPNFSEPALEAVRQWKFKPAMLEGKPVSFQAMQNIEFKLDAAHLSRDAVTIEGKPKNLDKLPAEYQFDTPPRVLTTAQPVYPYELLAAKKKGSAQVVMIIDHTGRVTETKVVNASAPEFGYALAAAIAEGTSAPALKDGEPRSALVNRKQEFDEASRDLQTNDRDRAILKLLTKKPEEILSAGQLDQPPKPAIRVAPKQPTQQGVGQTGKAVIEIIIDEDGTVLLPKIIEASAPEFGYAAAQAIKQWVFNKPLAQGKPALVRVRVPFEFKPTPTPK